MSQRAELTREVFACYQELVIKGLVINRVDKGLFGEKLGEAGYHREWKAQFGDKALAWALFQTFAGRLA